jgi:hypothetical protein
LTTIVSSRRRSIWLWIVAALALDIAGSQHVYTLANVGAAVVAALALLWIAPPSIWRALAPSERAPHRPFALLLPVGFVAAVLDIASFVPPDGGWTPERLTLLIAGLIALLMLIRFSAIVIATGAFVLGTIIRVIHMENIPVTPPNGDMLPLVQGAIGNLLAGNSPYQTYQMPWEVPLTYLPVTWLSYLPAYLLGADLRWTNIGAELVIAGAIIWLSKERNGWETAWQREPGLVLWGWFYLQPSVIHWDTGNTAPITWALLAVTLALVLAERHTAAAIALGITAAGTPFVAVFALFIGLHWLRERGLVETIRLTVVAGVVAGLIIAPFLLWSPGDFVTGTYRWFNNIDGWPRQKWVETDPHIWSVITGFSGEFWARGTEGWLKPIQALIVLLTAALYWLRGARLALLTSHAVAAFLGFMLFNPVLWPYLYNPALIVGLVGIAGGALTGFAYESVRAPVAEPARTPSVQSKGL